MGLLTIASVGARAGAVFGFDNTLEAVEDATTPWAQTFGLALASVATGSVATARRARGRVLSTR